MTGGPPGHEWAPEHAVDAARAATLVGDQFPALRGAAVLPLAEGWDNSVYVVDDVWAFRFPRRAVAVAGLRREAALLPGSPRRCRCRCRCPSGSASRPTASRGRSSARGCCPAESSPTRPSPTPRAGRSPRHWAGSCATCTGPRWPRTSAVARPSTPCGAAIPGTGRRWPRGASTGCAPAAPGPATSGSTACSQGPRPWAPAPSRPCSSTVTCTCATCSSTAQVPQRGHRLGRRRPGRPVRRPVDRLRRVLRRLPGGAPGDVRRRRRRRAGGPGPGAGGEPVRGAGRLRGQRRPTRPAGRVAGRADPRGHLIAGTRRRRGLDGPVHMRNILPCPDIREGKEQRP